MLDGAVRWIIFLAVIAFSASLSVIITPIGSLIVGVYIVHWLGKRYPAK